MNPIALATALLLCMLRIPLYAQDAPAPPGMDRISSHYIDAIAGKSASLSDKLDKQNSRYLAKLQRQEQKLYKKLARKDSTAAADGLKKSTAQYTALQQKLTNSSQQINRRAKKYMPFADTLATSLQFLRSYGDLFKKGLSASNELNKSISLLGEAQSKLAQAEDIEAFVKQRREELTAQLEKVNMGGALQSFNKEAYYYSAQVKEYREVLSDPNKAEQKALTLLNQLPAFRDFMQQHSQLASLFGAPGSNGPGGGALAMTGLQTRDQLQDLVTSTLGPGGTAAWSAAQQNMQLAQSQLNSLKNRLAKAGGGDVDIPDFKPNNQKTKAFFQRLEYGTNIQTQKTSGFFPATTDFALSAGYKLNDNNTVGIGASYKMGWGSGIQHIALSNEGVGFRSFADMKIKGSFYASGGFEYNYQQPFQSLPQIHDLDSWSQSGLIGVSKVISVKSSVFKKTRLQLLWDFLSYQQRPVTQPIKFRVGYNF